MEGVQSNLGNRVKKVGKLPERGGEIFSMLN